jgi:hypothetical protein
MGVDMDVRARDMAELIVLDHDALWLRTNLLPAEIVGRLGILLAAVSTEHVTRWLQ